MLLCICSMILFFLFGVVIVNFTQFQLCSIVTCVLPIHTFAAKCNGTIYRCPQGGQSITNESLFSFGEEIDVVLVPYLEEPQSQNIIMKLGSCI